MISIDLNSDMGERPAALEDGSEEELMRWITSANIACGGHAGNEETMEQTVRLALKYGVGVGAHPGFPDRTNFGRLEMRLSPDEIRSTVYEQVRALALATKKVKADLVHVKPHGALYNLAAKSASVASVISDGVAKWSRDLILVGLAQSLMLEVWTSRGFRVAGEAFADRAYEPDGSLRSRKFADALVADPKKAAERALRIAQTGIVTSVDGSEITVKAKTLCVHSDTPDSHRIVRTVREGLERAGISVKPLMLLD